MSTSAEELVDSGNHERLMDIAEPDAEYLLAAEQEDSAPARRRALVVLVADRELPSGEDTDVLVAELLAEAGFEVDGAVTVRSKKSQIRKAIETAVIGGTDFVVTIGGTGVGPRDKTPEATKDVLDQEVAGIAQALRASGQVCGSIEATCSRGVTGISGSTVVVNLASTRAAIRDGLATLPPLVHHLIDQLQKHSV